MTKTNWVFETGMAIHLIGNFMWMPLFYLVKLPMNISWWLGYVPFQVVAWTIMFPIVYRKWRNNNS